MGHAVNATMFVVTVWVSHVVLHVADQHVVPVSNIQRAVATNFDVAWPEVLIRRQQDWINLFRTDVGSIVGHFMLQDTQHTNDVANQKVTFVLIRERRT